MRPKHWDLIAKITDPLLENEEQENFLVQYYITILYRSLRLIEKHQNTTKLFRKDETINKLYKDIEGIDFNKLKERIKKELSDKNLS